MKKYTILLITLTLLASCGAPSPDIESTKITNDLPQLKVPNNTLEKINQETESIERTENIEDTKTIENVSQDTGLETPKIIELKQTYNSPAGEEYVGFRINMNGEKIDSVEVTPILTQNEISEKRISAFAEGITNAISGKTLAQAENISIVWGSSLTTNAFKEALKNM